MQTQNTPSMKVIAALKWCNGAKKQKLPHDAPLNGENRKLTDKQFPNAQS